MLKNSIVDFPLPRDMPRTPPKDERLQTRMNMMSSSGTEQKSRIRVGVSSVSSQQTSLSPGQWPNGGRAKGYHSFAISRDGWYMHDVA